MRITTIYPVTDIERRRRKLGWTMSELAARAGVHRNTIARLEKPKPDAVTPRVVKALSDGEHPVVEI